MASPVLLVHSDCIIGSSQSSTDCKEQYCMNNPNRPTFERRPKSSLRKNLFPGKNPTLFCQTKNFFSLGVAKINKTLIDLKCSIQSATQVGLQSCSYHSKYYPSLFLSIKMLENYNQ